MWKINSETLSALAVAECWHQLNSERKRGFFLVFWFFLFHHGAGRRILLQDQHERRTLWQITSHYQESHWKKCLSLFCQRIIQSWDGLIDNKSSAPSKLFSGILDKHVMSQRKKTINCKCWPNIHLFKHAVRVTLQFHAANIYLCAVNKWHEWDEQVCPLVVIFWPAPFLWQQFVCFLNPRN